MEKYVNKVAVVTGSSSGIGAGISKELVKRGCIVVGLARRLDKLQLLLKEIDENRNSLKGTFHPIQCDISDERQLEDVFIKIEKQYGVPSILVNNAGIAPMKKLENLNYQIFDAIIQTNVKSLLFATKMVMEMMIKNSVAGHIINVNSIAGHYMPPKEDFMLYSGSKQLTRFLTEMIREKIVKERLNIKISSISPGVVRTELLDPKAYEHLFQLLSVEDVVKACIFILDTPSNVLISELKVVPIHQCTTIMYPGKEPNDIIHETKTKL